MFNLSNTIILVVLHERAAPCCRHECGSKAKCCEGVKRKSKPFSKGAAAAVIVVVASAVAVYCHLILKPLMVLIVVWLCIYHCCGLSCHDSPSPMVLQLKTQQE